MMAKCSYFIGVEKNEHGLPLNARLYIKKEQA